jgi:putative transposase
MELAEYRRRDAQSAACVRMRGPNSTDRGKNGRKRSLLVDGIGVPLSLVASCANTHDVKLLEATLDQIVMEMPGRAGQYNLCVDAGYKGAPASNAAAERDYKPHIKQRREEAHDKLTEPGFKARRWVVERTHSWINRFRKLLVSFEKTEASYVALPSLACAMICWRQTVSIYG